MNFKNLHNYIYIDSVDTVDINIIYLLNIYILPYIYPCFLIYRKFRNLRTTSSTVDYKLVKITSNQIYSIWGIKALNCSQPRQKTC